MTFQGFKQPEQNYSKLPHEFIDLLPEIDSLAELKVVLYVLRHTWGFSEYDKPKKMTLDELQNGRKRRDGSRMDGGTGLSVNSIKSGAEKAVERGILTVEVDETDAARIEKWYCLNMSDESKFDTRLSNLDTRLSKVDSLPSKVDNRTEKETIERKKNILSSADKTVDGILVFEQMAEQAKQNGYWQGRELIPPHLMKYADWWNSKTGQVMKGKVNSAWLKEFTRWYDEEMTTTALDEAFEHVRGWKKLIEKPADITSAAKAINDLPEASFVEEKVRLL